jgi:hypothetical protein
VGSVGGVLLLHPTAASVSHNVNAVLFLIVPPPLE